MLFFLSNIQISSTFVGNEMPLQSNSSACLTKSFVILFGFCANFVFNPIMTAHLKHISSSFFGFTMAFLFPKKAGSGNQEEPPRGFHFAKRISNFKTFSNFQLLPFRLKFLIFFNHFYPHFIISFFLVCSFQIPMTIGMEKRIFFDFFSSHQV